MVEDFINPHGQPGYDSYDLNFGIDYAQALIDEGFKKEPFYGYDLKKFIEWAKGKL